MFKRKKETSGEGEGGEGLGVLKKDFETKIKKIKK
jgi:hypothetical protein